jgi:ATP-dependent protease Clp ATPase subunit
MPTLTCSFCGLAESAHRKLIAGPKVFICSECVRIAADVLSEVPDDPKAVCALCRRADAPENYMLIEGRGYLCSGCAGTVHRALLTVRPL